MFQGFVQLESSITLYILVKNSSNTPVAADAAPTVRIFGAAGELGALAGTSSTAGVTGLYKFTVTAAAASGFAAGQTFTLLASGTISATGWASNISFGVV